MSIKDFINNLINSLLDGSFERMRVINQMNAAFKEYFTSGEFGRMCKVSISQGKSEYAHEMSALWSENVAFVRQLMALGFDTLVIKGKTTGKSQYYALKHFANLNQYFIK